eukprot:68131-Prymnesium_polylepis.1
MRLLASRGGRVVVTGFFISPIGQMGSDGARARTHTHCECECECVQCALSGGVGFECQRCRRGILGRLGHHDLTRQLHAHTGVTWAHTRGSHG